MKNLIPLMQREWLQHRFAWAMLILVPLALAVLPLAFAQIEFDAEMAGRSAPDLAALVALISIVATTAILFLLVWVTSLFMMSSLARRDHADRSVEFWLSLPTGHAESLAVPLLVHLVLVPAGALLAGLLGGYAVSLLMVSRFVGVGEWLALPWGALLAGTWSMVARVIAGLPLATLWLMPLILLAVLSNALFKRWGLPVLAVALSLGSVVLQRVFGQPMLSDLLSQLSRGAGLSLAGASGRGIAINEQTSPAQALADMPAWAVHDLLAALREAASPLFLGVLVVSAGLFYALVLWRQRGAGMGGS